MFAQTLQDALTLSEVAFLKKQVWWTGCKDTPYICRGGVMNENLYLLVVTDGKNVWLTRGEEEQVLEEKEKYNKALQTKGLKDILNVLDQPLKEGNRATDFKKLQFRKNKEEDLIFTMEFQVVMYPFKWEFFLTKMDDQEIFSILVDDLLNPMARTIKSLELRGDEYKKQANMVEKEMQKRFTDREKAMYISNISKDDEHFLANFKQTKDQVDGKLVDFNFGPAAKFFLSTLLPIQIKEEKSLAFTLTGRSKAKIVKDSFQGEDVKEKKRQTKKGEKGKKVLQPDNLLKKETNEEEDESNSQKLQNEIIVQETKNVEGEEQVEKKKEVWIRLAGHDNQQIRQNALLKHEGKAPLDSSEEKGIKKKIVPDDTDLVNQLKKDSIIHFQYQKAKDDKPAKLKKKKLDFL